MRITGGTYRGRIIAAPKGKDVRPSTDKVRQAIFNILNSYDLPEETQVLDVFCGTGALGLEALSRFASHCVFIDQSAESLKFCKQNIMALSLDHQAEILKKDATKLGTLTSHLNPASLVFLDPPYRKNLVMPALQALAERQCLTEQALCVIECEKETLPILPDNFSLLDDRTYGECRILFARYLYSHFE